MIMVNFSPKFAFLSLLLLLFAIMCNLRICEMKAFCNERDQQILLCFKQGLTDPSNMLSTWSNKEDCCQWRGVQCDDITGRVTDLSLPCSTNDDPIIYDINTDKSSCLEGEFHLSLFQLEFLNYLDLSNNNFKSIHASMDCQNLSLVNTPPHRSVNSSNLAYLDLSDNENLVINDMRWLLRLSPLEYLNLNYIDLQKHTDWLQMMTMLPSLFELHLSDCLLQSVSPSLEYVNFTSLKHLYLAENNFFSELPKWLFNLSDLSIISLEYNRFHGQIPNTLLILQKLESLYLGHNKLSGGIPDWLGQFESMKNLYLYENLFTGPIPATLGNLSSLIGLDISSNQLNDSLPESLGQLSNLIELRVEENSLFGLVSRRNFANLSKLQILHLGSPSFIFCFNPHWIPPFQLQGIYLEYAKLKLIPWLYTQTSLFGLRVHRSTFESVSPFKFWSWTTHIQYLYLKNNSMNWDMSNVLLNSKVIDLRSNCLRGGLPQLTSKVMFFSIVENSMSGPLSPLLCHKMNGGNNLQYLELFSNLLSGGLTNCWENWKSLIHISQGSNSLTGMIPHSILGTLTNIVSLHLQDNNLYGEISGFLRNCQKLMFLDLGGNKFYGKIPNWIGKNVNMRALRLRSNEFTGDIPLQICKLSSLIVLDLANNRLSGKIPHCLDNITSMVFENESTLSGIQIYSKFSFTYYFGLSLFTKGNAFNYYENYARVIDLSSNRLSGKIPTQVFSLIALQSLNFSNNQLMGIIPEEIGNMIKLESLDFSNNKFSGEIPQSMSAISYLEVLNLSFNNLRGQIPLGTQLQSFSPLSYEGNPKLCGTPLDTKCTNGKAPDDKKVVANDEKKSDELLEGLYMGMGVGFGTSFWIVCGSIFFVRRWRHAYFKFLGDMKDRVYVKVILWCTTRMET